MTNLRYNLQLLGSILCGIASSGFIFLPSKLAAVWFGEEERATATSIAVAADLLGLALGYSLPTFIVENKHNLTQVGNELGTYLLISAVQALATFIFVCITVTDAPPTPPSHSEWKKTLGLYRLLEQDEIGSEEKKSSDGDKESISSPLADKVEIEPDHEFTDYKTVLTNPYFVMILCIGSVIFGLESMLMITVNEILIPKFPGYETKVGLMVSFGLFVSMFGNIFIGKLLDQTHAFKKITIATTGLSCLLSAAYSLLFHFGTSFYSLFVMHILLVGVFTTYYTTSFQHGAEMTYPISEARSGVLLMWFSQIYSLLFGESGSVILHYTGPNLLLLCVTTVFSLLFFISLFLKDTGPRTSVVRVKYDDVKPESSNL